MSRALFVIAAGLIGLVLGVGLSLAADAIAGSHLSEPVPLQIRPDVTKSPAPYAKDHQDSNRHDGSGEGGASASETPEPTGAHVTATATPSATNDGHDAGSGSDTYDPGSDSHDGSSGKDD
ncbi:MAG: hypothetical protein ACXVPL_10545 [Actinomycetota bacterium]